MRTVESDALAVGDVVSFEAAMQTPKNAGNPAEFDNEEYCYIKGVTGSVFLRDGNWNMVGKGRMTLAMRALETRKKVVDLYGRLGFEKEEHAKQYAELMTKAGKGTYIVLMTISKNEERK